MAELSNTNVSIRRVDDLSGPEFRQVAAIYSSSFPSNETRPLAKTKALLESGRYVLYVAEAGGEVAAFALVYAWREFALLDYMAVAAGRQRMGIGGALFRGLVAALDCGIMLLEVQKPDGASAEKADRLRFYKRLGATAITDGYMLPPYDGSEPEEMYLMVVAPTRQPPLRKGDVRRFVKMIYSDVYGYGGTDLVEETMRSFQDVASLRE